MASNTVYRDYGRQSLEPRISPLPHQICDETACIEDRIRRLDEERASLLRRQNDMKSPVGKRLPPEILSHIFRHACPPIDFRPHTLDLAVTGVPRFRLPPESHPQVSGASNTDLHGRYLLIVLGSVCSYWRQVVQSTSVLWTTVKLAVWVGTVANHAQLLEHYLWKTKAFSCSVELVIKHNETIDCNYPHHDYGAPRESLLRPIQDVLFSPLNSSNIATLRLIDPPYEWLHILPATFPNLEDLTLAWPTYNSLEPLGQHDENQLTMIKSETPRLQRITIVSELKVVLPWDQIISLHLSNMSAHSCSEMLSQCRNLVECEIIHSFPGDEPVNFSGRPQVILKHLEYLRWEHAEYGPPDLDIAFFQHTTLPALKMFRWSIGYQLRVPVVWAAYLEFFTCLPSSMTTLEIAGNIYVPNKREKLQALLAAIPQLEKLTLNELFPLEVLPLILEMLGSHKSTGSETTQILPSLRTLELTGYIFDSRRATNILHFYLVRMLTGRFLQSKDSPFCVKLETPLLWFEGQREELRALVRKGFNLELWENNELVKWLY